MKHENEVQDVVGDLLAWKSVASGLTGLVMAWSVYAMLTTKELGFSKMVPAWITSHGFFMFMAIASGVSFISLSLKSLLPAVLLWIAGIALIAINGPSSSSLYVFIGAAISTLIYEISPARARI